MKILIVFCVLALFALAYWFWPVSGSPELQKRKRLGKIERLMHPGYGSCHRCGRPWSNVECHSTPYSISNGLFPLCEQCWGELTPHQRLPYYRELIDEWMDSGQQDHNGQSWDDLWSAVEASVLAGK